MQFYVAVIRQNCVKGRTNQNSIVVHYKEIRHHWDKKITYPIIFFYYNTIVYPFRQFQFISSYFLLAFSHTQKNDLLKHFLYCCNISNSKANFSGQNVKPSMFKECLQLGKIQLLQSKIMRALHTHAHTCQRDYYIQQSIKR